MRCALVLVLLLSLIAPASAQPSLTVELNDAVLDVVKGELTISRLDTQLKVSMLDVTPTANIEGTDLRYKDYTCRVYETADGVEWDIILAEPPKASEWFMKVEDSDLSWHYQPPLNEEITESGWTVNATHAYNDKGELVANRPINVVGSYAVYGQKIGGKYRTGKVFHVYRPLVYDAKGSETWGTLQYSSGILTVSVNPTWLDKAAYPVTIDPVFGYTTQGGSCTSMEDRIRGSTCSPVSSGDVIRVSAYILKENISAPVRFTAKAGLYFTNNTFHAGTTEISIAQDSSAWHNFTFTVSPTIETAVDYIPCVWGDSSGDATLAVYYDSLGVVGHRENIVYGAWPDPVNWDASASAWQFSIYVTYTSIAPDNTPPTYSSSLIYNETHIRYPCEFNATLNDETVLSHYIFGWNASGAWVNMTAVNMGGVAEYNVSINRTLPLNISLRIGSELYFNDTSNNWGTATVTLTTTGAGGGFNILLFPVGILGVLAFTLMGRRR